MRLALALVALLAACDKGDHEVHLTLHVDETVPGDRVDAIQSLEIAVLGAEPGDFRYTIKAELRDRETTWIYRSKISAPLQFSVVARGASRTILAAGKSKQITPAGSSVSDTIHLGTDPPPPDKRRLGESCTAGVDTCASGFCVDGVCCESACEGACNSCKGQRPGTCAPAAAGTNPRKICTSDVTSPCGPDGTCDGAGSCRIAPKGKLCVTSTCKDGVQTSAAICDGLGTCATPITRDCAPYACNSLGSGCATICTAGAGCAPSVACTVGSCGKVAQGGRCFGANDCMSPFQCVDGYCCDGPCSGSCQSCKEPGQEGSCAMTAPGADDPHKVCKDGGASACGQNGKCDGVGGCQSYPTGTLCKPGGCNGDKTGYTAPSTCAGDGTPCPLTSEISCAPYLCSTDGAPGCMLSCGECAYYEPDKAPPFADRCAAGSSCVDQCLSGDARFVCQ